MELWTVWFTCVNQLKKACSRHRTFFWMTIVLIGMSIRCGDFSGVTSIVRVVGLESYCYERLLDFFHSPGLNIELLIAEWTKLVVKIFSPYLVTLNGRYILIADGIKVSKEGKKMPAVKSLHQDSESNSKSEYIMGHSCQAIAILASVAEGFFAIPLISQIHEGLIFSNRWKKTLYDKLFGSIDMLDMDRSYYFVADAYYAVSKMINGMVNNGNHLITRVKKNAVAYMPEEQATEEKLGRPKKYGEKFNLKTFFKDKNDAFTTINSPIYSEKRTSIKIYEINLLCRSAGRLVKYVFVAHPGRGQIILMSTDLTLSAEEIIRLYGLRFKIEVSFKQSLHTIGAYAYHFWMKGMKKIKRGAGDQYLHHETEKYREEVKRKINAYHRHIQLGLIAQGLIQYLSMSMSSVVWNQFGSWIRTIRPGIPPSEQVTSMALKNSLPEFLMNNSTEPNFKKCLLEKIDFSRAEGMRLVA